MRIPLFKRAEDAGDEISGGRGGGLYKGRLDGLNGIFIELDATVTFCWRGDNIITTIEIDKRIRCGYQSTSSKLTFGSRSIRRAASNQWALDPY